MIYDGLGDFARCLSFLLLAVLLGFTAAAASSAPAIDAAAKADRDVARGVLRELVEIDTSAPHGTGAAAEAIAHRLAAAGFAVNDVRLLAPPDQPSRANVVVRLRGSGRDAPLLVIGHIDVVEAPAQGWTVDPFQLTEREGYFYGRGVLDLKGEDTAILTALMRMKHEGFRPQRDIIAAFTADEEAGNTNGVQWLLKAHPELVSAGLAINPDEGAAVFRGGRRVYYGIQTSTKRYVTYRLETTGQRAGTPRSRSLTTRSTSSRPV